MVGGSISSYYYLVLFLMSGYTFFKFESEIASRLYTMRSEFDTSEENTL